MPSINFVCGATLVAVLLSTSSVFALTDYGQKDTCTSDEHVEFSCHIKDKMVSLCATGEPGALTSLTYRYGVPGKIENEFVARKDNSKRFFATYSPASPGALVIQVWFDRGDYRYLLTECVGGNRPREAGLAALHGNKVLKNESCPRFKIGDHPAFADDLITFRTLGEVNISENMHSTTELLKIDPEAANDIDRIYRVNGHPDC